MRISPHRLVAVHLRHHDVHQHDAEIRRATRSARSPAGRWWRSPPPSRGSRAPSSARRCCARRRPRPAPCGRAGLRWIRAGARAAAASRSGSSATTRCRNSAVSSNRRSGDWTSLSTTLLATVRSCASSSSVSSLPVNTTTGRSRERAIRLHPLEQLEAGHVGQAQVDDAAIDGRLLQHLERLGAGADRRDLDVVVQQQLDDAPALDFVVLDRRAAASCAARRNALIRSNAFSRSSVVAGLTRYEKAPCESPCCRSSSTDRICTGMWRVAGSSFRLFRTVQPSMSGRNTSRVIAVGRYWRASVERRLAAVGDNALEALVAREPSSTRA